MFTEQEQRTMNTIDFEKDQEQVLDRTTNINKLADKNKRTASSRESHRTR